MARSDKATPRLRGRRGDLILAGVVVFIAAAVIANVPGTIRDNRYVKRDLATYDSWVKSHGGPFHWGRPFPDEFGSVETHNHLDIICFPHYPLGKHHRPDYKMYLIVDSHGSGTTKVLVAQPGVLRPKPTDSGPKCGKGPPPPPGRRV